MTRIKICGLSRPCDIDYVNAALPDYCGFVVQVPKSRRNVSPAALQALTARLDPRVLPVGVFVDAPIPLVAGLLNSGVLAMAQLHGQEDAAYLAALRAQTDRPLIQAFRVSGPGDLARAARSAADHILLDNGPGGTGQAFDWRLLQGFARPYFLAGGLGPRNLAQAVGRLHPFAVDMSSGVETDGVKDPKKIDAAIAAVRSLP